jgi:hypothetical protein
VSLVGRHGLHADAAGVVVVLLLPRRGSRHCRRLGREETKRLTHKSLGLMR